MSRLWLPVRLLALAASLICWTVLWLVARLRTLLGRPRPRCVALYYHAVRADERERFAWQMEELLRLARPLAADATELPDGGDGLYAMVTFDDGFRCVAENAVPELVRRGIPAALFVPAGCLGGTPPWLIDGGHPDAGERLLDVDDLRLLPRAIRVGSHSLDHVRLSSLHEDEIRRQLIESRARLEHITGRPVELLSAPHGDYNVRVLDLAREAGYSRVFTVSPELACLDEGRLCYGRFLTSPRDWRIEFRLKLRGAYCWLPAGSVLKRRLFDWLERRRARREGKTGLMGRTGACSGKST